MLAATAWKALPSFNICARGQFVDWRSVVQAVKIVGSVSRGVAAPHDLDILVQLSRGTNPPFILEDGAYMPSLYQQMLPSLQHSQYHTHFIYQDHDLAPNESIDVTAMFLS